MIEQGIAGRAFDHGDLQALTTNAGILLVEHTGLHPTCFLRNVIACQLVGAARYLDWCVKSRRIVRPVDRSRAHKIDRRGGRMDGWPDLHCRWGGGNAYT